MSDDFLASVRRGATELLTGIAQGTVDPEVLRPQPQDYEQIFQPSAANPMRVHFQALWATAPVPRANAGQTELQLHAALAMLLSTDSSFSRNFPGGYRRVAPHLSPGLVWCVWTWTKPGLSSGMSYDGLVCLDERFVWLPKPWRVLSR